MLVFFDAGDHRVVTVQDDLVIVFSNSLFDYVIIHEDSCGRVRLAANPHFHLPAVPVKVGTLPFIVEQPVARIDLHLFIDRDVHLIILAMQDIILL
jgi:hypothetical protein